MNDIDRDILFRERVELTKLGLASTCPMCNGKGFLMRDLPSFEVKARRVKADCIWCDATGLIEEALGTRTPNDAFIRALRDELEHVHGLALDSAAVNGGKP